jgi:hypothetical protein
MCLLQAVKRHIISRKNARRQEKKESCKESKKETFKTDEKKYSGIE